MSLILTLEHAYAAAVSDLKKTARTIQGPILTVLTAVHADAGTIEKITALVSPQLANLERTGDAVLGLAIKVIGDAATTVNTDGSVNLTMAAQLVADVKSIVPMVKNATAQSGLAPA